LPWAAGQGKRPTHLADAVILNSRFVLRPASFTVLA
jgi:hypothetical protein